MTEFANPLFSSLKKCLTFLNPWTLDIRFLTSTTNASSFSLFSLGPSEKTYNVESAAKIFSFRAFKVFSKCLGRLKQNRTIGASNKLFFIICDQITYVNAYQKINKCFSRAIMTIIKKQTILGTIYAYLGVLVGTISQAFIIPNYLSIEENGLIAIIMSWTYILVLVTNLGFANAGTRYFDKFRNESKQHKGFLFNGFIFLIIGFSISTLIIYFFKDSIVNSSVSDTSLFQKFYYYILPITFFTGVFNLFDNYAKGLFDTVMGNFLSQFLQRFLVLIIIIIYASHLIDLDLFMPLWAIAISFPALLMILHAIQLGNFNLMPNRFLFKSDFKKDFLSFAGFSIITGLSTIVISRLDTLMIYQYLGLGQTGIYNTCLFFGSVMTMSYNINIKASSAIVIQALESKDYPKVQQIFKKSSLTQAIFGTIILCLVWINIDTLFSFIKPEYAAGKYVILIIGIAKLYDLSSGINALILGYSKYYKLDSILVITFIALLFLLNHYLIPMYGLNGAALAALIATVYYNSVRNILIWKYFKMHPYTFSLLKIFLLGIFVVFIGMYLPDSGIKTYGSFIDLCYKTGLIGIAYIAIIYRLNISEDINGLIRSMLQKVRILK
jgi:O-antigen/teichoic acid export membrane protein